MSESVWRPDRGPEGKSSGVLGDTPWRSYGRKLSLFARFAEAELRNAVHDLPIRTGDLILDAGCGTGEMTRLLAERVGPAGSVVGVDLAASHLQMATASTTIDSTHVGFVQCDLRHLPFSAASFGGVWIANTLNHLPHSVEAVRDLAAHTVHGGWIAIAQGHMLWEMVFAWDERLERAATRACRHYYRDRYGLTEADTTAVRRVYGVAREAGLRDVRARTYLVERTAPLTELDEDYYRQVVFEGAWGARLDGYIGADDADLLRRLTDPDDEQYALRRPDFHAIQTFTVVTGTVV